MLRGSFPENTRVLVQMKDGRIFFETERSQPEGKVAEEPEETVAKDS